MGRTIFGFFLGVGLTYVILKQPAEALKAAQAAQAAAEQAAAGIQTMLAQYAPQASNAIANVTGEIATPELAGFGYVGGPWRVRRGR